MIKLKGYEVTRMIRKDGMADYFAPGAVLYMPELESELLLKQFKVTTEGTEILYFDPLSFSISRIAAATTDIVEEEDIPEEDR